MTAIRIKCPDCGELDLSPQDLSLFVPPSDEKASYSFTCPECEQTVERPTSRKTAALLIAAGVEPISAPAKEIDLPPDDRSPDPDAPAFTLDDLIEFHLLLQDDRTIAELMHR